MALLNREQVRALLPKVGDRLMEHPTTLIPGVGSSVPPARACTVVYVNADHCWYTVEFDSGLRESYKLPKTKLQGEGGPRL